MPVAAISMMTTRLTPPPDEMGYNCGYVGITGGSVQ